MRSPVVLSVLLLVPPLQALAADMPALAERCLTCHGADGRPALADVPVIAGQQPLYLENAIRAYRDGQRAAGQALVMHEIVKDATDADIKALAQWFGAQQ
jgi:cytochrome c553